MSQDSVEGGPETVASSEVVDTTEIYSACVEVVENVLQKKQLNPEDILSLRWELAPIDGEYKDIRTSDTDMDLTVRIGMSDANRFELLVAEGVRPKETPTTLGAMELKDIVSGFISPEGFENADPESPLDERAVTETAYRIRECLFAKTVRVKLSL